MTRIRGEMMTIGLSKKINIKRMLSFFLIAILANIATARPPGEQSEEPIPDPDDPLQYICPAPNPIPVSISKNGFCCEDEDKNVHCLPPACQNFPACGDDSENIH